MQPLFQPNVFLSIDDTGLVTIVASRSEMGTGIKTDLPLVLADELEADWNRVKIVQGQGDPKYGDQNTDGSRSTWQFFGPMRMAGATARQMLETAAAQTWNVPAGECQAAERFRRARCKRPQARLWRPRENRGDDAGAAVEPGAAEGPEGLALYRQAARDRRPQGHRPGPRDLWHRRGGAGHEICLGRALPGLWRQGQILRPQGCAVGRRRRTCRRDPGDPDAVGLQAIGRHRGHRQQHLVGATGPPAPQDRVGLRAQCRPRQRCLPRRTRSDGQGARQSRAQPRRCRRCAGGNRHARIRGLFCPSSGACPDGSAQCRGALGRQYLRDLVADAKPDAGTPDRRSGPRHQRSPTSPST